MVKQYRYKALDRNSNRRVNGTMEASNPLALEKILSDNNLILIDFKETKGASALATLFSSKITSKELITMFVTLEQLEKAGIPIINSLKDIKDYTANPKLKNIGQDLYESVKNGSLLSEAMSKHKKVFDEVSISLINMGEKTGQLELALKNIVENIKWSSEIKRKTMKAIKGPLATLSLMLGIAIIMLKFVVPTVLSFLLDQELNIPSVTKSLIVTSNFVQDNFIYILAIPTLLFIATKIFCKISNKFAIFIDALKLKMPVFGQIIKKIDLSRFAKFFGITFSSGIQVLDCMDITIKVIKNKAIKQELILMKEDIASGSSISKCLESSPYFPLIVARMFKIGEDTGNMVGALDNINYFYETEINDAIDAVIASLKPVMLFVMGGLLIWIIVGVFGPIYGSFSKLM